MVPSSSSSFAPSPPSLETNLPQVKSYITIRSIVIYTSSNPQLPPLFATEHIFSSIMQSLKMTPYAFKCTCLAFLPLSPSYHRIIYCTRPPKSFSLIFLPLSSIASLHYIPSFILPLALLIIPPPSSPNPSAHNSISSSASPQKYKTKTESAKMPLPEIPASFPPIYP